MVEFFFFFLNIRNARNSAECYARTIRTTHCKINQLIILSENIRRVYIARKLYSFRRTKDERQQVDVCNTRPRDAHPSTHPPDAKSSSPRARVPVNACVRVCSRTGWMGVGVGVCVCVCMKCPGHQIRLSVRILSDTPPRHTHTPRRGLLHVDRYYNAGGELMTSYITGGCCGTTRLAGARANGPHHSPVSLSSSGSEKYYHPSFSPARSGRPDYRSFVRAFPRLCVCVCLTFSSFFAMYASYNIISSVTANTHTHRRLTVSHTAHTSTATI